MKQHFSNPHISTAAPGDAAAIAALLNSAYRGEESKKGWTTEAHLIGGPERSNTGEISTLLQQNETVFLIYRDDRQVMQGCVNLQKHGKRLYLGMFSVAPRLQGGGIGRALLQAAEEYARERQCTHIYMTVIGLRRELVDWYLRRGYADTGERKLLTEKSADGRSNQDFELLVLEKEVPLRIDP